MPSSRASSAGRLRDELLNKEIFESLAHARRLLERWRLDYNHVRPHSAHRGLPPAKARLLAADARPGLVDVRPSARQIDQRPVAVVGSALVQAIDVLPHLLPVPARTSVCQPAAMVAPLPEAGLACRPQSLPEEVIHNQLPFARGAGMEDALRVGVLFPEDQQRERVGLAGGGGDWVVVGRLDLVGGAALGSRTAAPCRSRRSRSSVLSTC
jgi:hypothetical protein